MICDWLLGSTSQPPLFGCQGPTQAYLLFCFFFQNVLNIGYYHGPGSSLAAFSFVALFNPHPNPEVQIFIIDEETEAQRVSLLQGSQLLRVGAPGSVSSAPLRPPLLPASPHSTSVLSIFLLPALPPPPSHPRVSAPGAAPGRYVMWVKSESTSLSPALALLFLWNNTPGSPKGQKK